MHRDSLSEAVQGALGEALGEVLATDDNILTYGLAQDAMHRLTHGAEGAGKETDGWMEGLPILCRESLAVYRAQPEPVAG